MTTQTMDIDTHLKPLPDLARFGIVNNPIQISAYRPEKDIPLAFTKDAVGNAGYDLCATENAVLQPGEIARVKVNAHFAIPFGCFGYLTPRSGLASDGLNVIQGVIDANYRGQVQAIVKNESFELKVIERGMRIAQILFLRHEIPVFEEVDSVEALGDTERGTDGFGASGKF